MAGLDPLSRGLSTGATFDPGIAELSIPAANVAALRATLSTGDVVSAKVLPPSGGADFVEINGQKLAAGLPSNVRPGDTLIIEVVAFEGDRLYVRNLGVDVSSATPASTSDRTGPIFVPDLADEINPAVYSPRTLGGTPGALPATNGGAPAPGQGGGTSPSTGTNSLGGGAYAPPQMAVTRPSGTPVYFIATATASSTNGAPATPSARLPAPAQAVPAAPAATAPVTARPPQQPGGSPPAAVLVAATVKQADPSASSTGSAAPPRQGAPLDTGLDPRSLVEAKIAALRAAATTGSSAAARDSSAASLPHPAAQARPGTLPPAENGVVSQTGLPLQAARQALTTQSDVAGQIAQRALVVARTLGAPALEATTGADPETASRNGATQSATASKASAAAGASAQGATSAQATATPSSADAAARTTAAASSPLSAAKFAEPASLVRALNLPVTPTTVGAARLALARPQFLPEALAALEQALPDGASDSRVASLKTIAAYVTRLDPQSPHFAQQLAAYVQNVVEGPEARVVALLDTLANAVPEPLPENGAAAVAQRAAAENANPAGAASSAAAAPHSSAQSGETGAASRGTAGNGAATTEAFKTPPLPFNASAATQASVVQRVISLAHDLKTQLQSFLESPPSGTTGNALAAAQTALTAVTANQVNAALVAQQNPSQIALSVPLPFSGGEPAHITIARDAPKGGRGLDGDNFHIGFVLDTQHLGTVALDMQTVGRTVNVKVQAESELFAGTFSRSLPELESRLKSLRYNVAAMQAGVAPRGRVPVENAPATAAVPDPTPAPAPVEDASDATVDKRV